MKLLSILLSLSLVLMISISIFLAIPIIVLIGIIFTGLFLGFIITKSSIKAKKV